MIKKLTWNEIMQIYHNNMQADFPAEEIKPIELITKLYNNGNCHAYGLYDYDDSSTNGTDDMGVLRTYNNDVCKNDARLVAYGIFEKPDCGDVWLLDYLAVDNSTRGNGYGSRFLKEIADVLKSTGGISSVVAEIERIDRAADDFELDIRTRRKRFYMRNGLSETGVYTKADGGIDYEIICLPVKRGVSGAEASSAMKNIYETLFEPGMYEISEILRS